MQAKSTFELIKYISDVYDKDKKVKFITEKFKVSKFQRFVRECVKKFYNELSAMLIANIKSN